MALWGLEEFMMIADSASARKAVPLTRWRRALAAAALASAASGAALAAPYAMTYTGTIASSDFPTILNGQTYTVTFVFDNQGNSPNSQTWTPTNLTCAIWRMNNAGNVVFAQNLVTTPPSAAGTVTTDASGALTSVFNSVTAQDLTSSGLYSVSGITLTPPVNWYANTGNAVFYDSGPERDFEDTFVDGIRMEPAFWSAPTPFTGNCLALPAPPTPVAVTAVPALGEWSLMLLALGAAGLGARRLRKRA